MRGFRSLTYTSVEMPRGGETRPNRLAVVVGLDSGLGMMTAFASNSGIPSSLCLYANTE